ncbi:hypothetical protein GOPIP_104_00050 [Gordonia polyisoprenivorans NBRC 16320 = JCM 10675]|uniref:Uncharacterized protein n=1 Tax=Gordonia polyisoprenivorans TaxID=84595 RepID=A0A846WW34_9ACTN|nr:hypothetical protein [Gordonia polyisoprenivorans]NKY04843.1 hypothetical protein [Gordonia polyisoprenivorans]OZC30828.1 hypothetical protein CJJ17_04670 [Gordonia polyisoprenivorans]GAB26465.1 hypothetical protein GOPIP_104_00050 [Gordonia polyisoprenivorans NBRC 16320 = JCM 10675]
MPISPSYFPGRDKRAIVTMSPVLHALGLLTDADLDRVHALIDRAEMASRTAYEAASLTLAAATTVGTKLAADDKVDSVRILKAATDLPSQNAVDAVATSIYETCIIAARDIAFANTGQIAGTLTEQYEQISDEFHTLDLGGVRSDRAAIDAGKVDEFRQFHHLQDSYNALREIHALARDNHLIPTPRMDSEHGEHWKFRLPKDRMQALGADELGRFAEELRRRPYCPTTRDEALAIGAGWGNAA